MIKKLLFSAAIAAVALSANAESKVLWESPEGPDGTFLDNWGPCYTMTAEKATEIKAGDFVVITVAGVQEDVAYPQVAFIDGTEGGWPPLTNEIVSGKQYPYESKLAVTYEMAEKIHEKGISFNGAGSYVSKISVEPGTIEVSANTVWFGPKQLNWGVAISIDKSIFADVKVGDKIEIYVDNQILKDENGDPQKDEQGNDKRKEATLQVIFGGWSGANVATYERWGLPSIIEYNEEDGIYTYNLNEEMEALEREIEVEKEVDGEKVKEKETKVFNCFEQLKNNGLVMQGPCLVYQVKYIQAPEVPDDPTAVNSIELNNVAPVYYDMQGRKIANPLNGNIYIVKKGAKASKVVF